MLFYCILIYLALYASISSSCWYFKVIGDDKKLLLTSRTFQINKIPTSTWKATTLLGTSIDQVLILDLSELVALTLSSYKTKKH